MTGKEIRNLEKNKGGGETSVSFSTLSTLGTNNSLLFSVEIILMPYDENNQTNNHVRLSIQTRKEDFLKGKNMWIQRKPSEVLTLPNSW